MRILYESCECTKNLCMHKNPMQSRESCACIDMFFGFVFHLNVLTRVSSRVVQVGSMSIIYALSMNLPIVGKTIWGIGIAYNCLLLPLDCVAPDSFFL